MPEERGDTQLVRYRQRQPLVPSSQLIWVGDCTLQSSHHEFYREDPPTLELLEPQIDEKINEPSGRGSHHFLADPLNGLLDLPRIRPKGPRDPAVVASKIYNGIVVKVPTPNGKGKVSSNASRNLSNIPKDTDFFDESSDGGFENYGLKRTKKEIIRAYETLKYKFSDSAAPGLPKQSADASLDGQRTFQYARWQTVNGHIDLPERKPILFAEPYDDKKAYKVTNFIRESRKPPLKPDEDTYSEREEESDDEPEFCQAQEWKPGRDVSEAFRARLKIRGRSQKDVNGLNQRYEKRRERFQREQQDRGHLSGFSMRVVELSQDANNPRRRRQETKTSMPSSARQTSARRSTHEEMTERGKDLAKVRVHRTGQYTKAIKALHTLACRTESQRKLVISAPAPRISRDQVKATPRSSRPTIVVVSPREGAGALA